MYAYVETQYLEDVALKIYGEGMTFKEMFLEQQVIHTEKTEIRSLPHMTSKYLFQMH